MPVKFSGQNRLPPQSSREPEIQRHHGDGHERNTGLLGPKETSSFGRLIVNVVACLAIAVACFVWAPSLGDVFEMGPGPDRTLARGAWIFILVCLVGAGINLIELVRRFLAR